MVLAKLRSARGAADRSGVGVLAARRRKDAGPVGCRDGVDDGTVTLLELGDLTVRERRHRLLPRAVGEELQGAHSELVVRLGKRFAAGVGQGESLRWPTTAAGAVDPLLADLDRAVGDEVVEVAAHRGGG